MVRMLLKYILSIGFALSVPFILLAFNLDRVSGWLSSMRTIMARYEAALRPIYLCLGILMIILVVIWTSSLASGIKAAVTVCAIVFITAVASFYALQALFDTTRLADEYDSDDSDAISSD